MVDVYRVEIDGRGFLAPGLVGLGALLLYGLSTRYTRQLYRFRTTFLHYLSHIYTFGNLLFFFLLAT